MQALLVHSPVRQFFNLIPKHFVLFYRLGTYQINAMEMAVRDWLRIQQFALWRSETFQPGRVETNASVRLCLLLAQACSYCACHLTACGWKQCDLLRRHWTVVLALFNDVVSAGQVNNVE
jgi:hypothetical protein